MTSPVLVYLDSQDFSRFSTSHTDYATYKPVRDSLMALRDQGKAKFVFSDIHIFETMPVSPAHASLGLERIRVIKEFCGFESLPSSITLMDREILALYGIEQDSPCDDWFPHFEIEEPDRNEILQNTVKELAANRKQRRALAKLAKKQFPSSSASAIADEFASKYPFLEAGKKVIQAYVAGNAGWAQVTATVRHGMRDVVGFSEWLVANWEKGQEFVAVVRNGNKKIKDTLVTLHTKMKSCFETEFISHDAKSEILRTIHHQHREAFFAEFVQRNSPTAIAQPSPMLPIDPKNAPSIYAAFSFLLELAYLSAVPKDPRNPSKHSASDFADAMHMFFLPHVDIFRADQFSGSVINKIQIGEGTTVCASLKDLPRLIAERYDAH